MWLLTERVKFMSAVYGYVQGLIDTQIDTHNNDKFIYLGVTLLDNVDKFVRKFDSRRKKKIKIHEDSCIFYYQNQDYDNNIAFLANRSISQEISNHSLGRWLALSNGLT